jgi:hypothetical protein
MSRQFNRRDFLPIGPFAATAPIFDVKLPHGLDFTLLNSPTPQKYLIETMPGGVALFDYNNDGLLDIFLVNGGRVTSPMLLPEKFDRGNPRYWNRLCRQSKDGSFTDVTEAAGLSSAGVTTAWVWRSATTTTMSGQTPSSPNFPARSTGCTTMMEEDCLPTRV